MHLPKEIHKVFNSITAKDITTKPVFYYNHNGLGCSSMFTPDGSNVIGEGLQHAGTMDAVTGIIADSFLCGPAKRYFGRQMNWFVFNQTKESVYAKMTQAKPPFSSRIEFSSSPFTTFPELIVQVCDANKHVIAQTNFSGANLPVEKPTKNSWKDFCETKLESHSFGNMPNPNTIRFSDFNINEKHQTLSSIVHLNTNSNHFTYLLPRNFLLDIVQQFSEEVVKSKIYSTHINKVFLDAPLRYVASTFDAILVHRDSPINFARHFTDTRPAVLGDSMRIDSSLPYMYVDPLPAWSHNVGTPLITKGIPCMAIKLAISQHEETVLRGTFYFLSFDP